MKRIICLLLAWLLVASSPTQANNRVPKKIYAPHRLQSKSLCDRLAEIKRLPFKNERVDDEIYNQLIQQGKVVVPCLINRLTDATKMKDPRSAPSYDDFRVGDVAFFVLLNTTNVPFEQMLPHNVTARLKDEGVYAYFEYVKSLKNRKILQNRWKAWLKQNPS